MGGKPRRSAYRPLAVERLEARRVLAAADAFEPNDSAATASLLPTQGAVQQHSLTPGDRDWLRFQLPNASDVVLRLGGPQGYAVSHELYAAERPSEPLPQPCGGSGEQYVYYLAAGSYLLRLSTFLTEVDAYSVSLQASPSRPSIERADFVQLAGEGFRALQYSPQGELSQLLWYGQELVLRRRGSSGGFTEEVITRRSSCSSPFSPRDFEQAQLLYTSDGVPHVLLLVQGALQHYGRRGGEWERKESLALNLPDFDEVVHLAAAVGDDDALHVFMTQGPWFGGNGSRGVYGHNRSGTWQFETAVSSLGAKTRSFGATHTIRYVSLAVDATGAAHVTYTPEFREPVHNGFSRPFDQLAYATNRSGTWVTRVIHQPPDDSGDSGMGASIAIGPDDQPAIAQFFVDRVATGSASFSHLLYHRRRADGSWQTETVATSPDGYVAGDGARFTGFAPQLQFDGLGRPHIAFSDYASQHFGGFGADEFAGQIRHAVREGSSWRLETVVSQRDPLRNQLLYPSLALHSHEIAFAGLIKTDTLRPDLTVERVEHRFTSASLPQTGLTIRFAAAEVTEGQSILMTVQRHHGNRSVPLTVTLHNADPLELQGAGSVVIPAGQDAATVQLTALDDRLADGAQTVRWTATASGYLPGRSVLRVLDLPPATVEGSVFRDTNANGIRDAGEPGVSQQVVYLDLDRDGKLAASEPQATSGADGAFTLAGVLPGDYRLAIRLPGDEVPLAPAAGTYDLTLAGGQTAGNLQFGLRPSGFHAASGLLVVDLPTGRELIVESSSDSVPRVRVLRDGVLDGALSSVRAPDVTRLLVLGGAGDNRLDLSRIQATSFPQLTRVEVYDNRGHDEVLGSALDDVIDFARRLPGVTAAAPCGSDRVSAGAGQDRVVACSLDGLVAEGGEGNDVLDVDAAGADVVLGSFAAPPWTSWEVWSSQGTQPNTWDLSPAQVALLAGGTPLRIRTDPRDRFLARHEWRVQETRHEGAGYVHVAARGEARLELQGNSYRQNPLDAIDVDGDGRRAPLDALLLINELNAPQFGGRVETEFTPVATVRPPQFLDPSGDGVIAPVDALWVINALNEPPAAAEGEAPVIIAPWTRSRRSRPVEAWSVVTPQPGAHRGLARLLLHPTDVDLLWSQE